MTTHVVDGKVYVPEKKNAQGFYDSRQVSLSDGKHVPFYEGGVWVYYVERPASEDFVVPRGWRFRTNDDTIDGRDVLEVRDGKTHTWKAYLREDQDK